MFFDEYSFILAQTELTEKLYSKVALFGITRRISYEPITNGEKRQMQKKKKKKKNTNSIFSPLYSHIACVCRRGAGLRRGGGGGREYNISIFSVDIFL